MENTLADHLNKVGARIGFESRSNKEILTIPAIVDFDTVTIGEHEARWDNQTQKWVQQTR